MRSRRQLKSQKRPRRRNKSQLISHNHLKLLLSLKNRRSQINSISLRRKIRRKSKLQNQRISLQRPRLHQLKKLKSPKRKLNQHHPRICNNKRRLTSQPLKLTTKSQRKLWLMRSKRPKR